MNFFAFTIHFMFRRVSFWWTSLWPISFFKMSWHPLYRFYFHRTPFFLHSVLNQKRVPTNFMLLHSEQARIIWNSPNNLSNILPLFAVASLTKNMFSQLLTYNSKLIISNLITFFSSFLQSVHETIWPWSHFYSAYIVFVPVCLV